MFELSKLIEGKVQFVRSNGQVWSYSPEYILFKVEDGKLFAEIPDVLSDIVEVKFSLV